MPPAFFAKLHGAATHFPIVLVLCSWALDATALVFAQRSWAPAWQSAGRWTMIAAALAVVPTVLSGLLVARGNVWGHGLLRMHHLFVWPSLALIVGLATWRAQVRDLTASRIYALYLIGGFVAAGLTSVAAYWGGELLLAL